MKNKASIRLLVLLLSVLLMLGISFLAVHLINAAYTERAASDSAAQGGQREISVGGEVPSLSVPSENVPSEPSEPPPLPPEPEQPPRIAYALPENGYIDTPYFDNVTFVGDSITQGLEIYATGIPNAHYCAYKSIGPRGIYDGSEWARPNGTREVPLQAIAATQPDNVYVLMGVNAIVAMEDEPFLAYYGEMVDAIREAIHPEVSIYIQSITPVLQGVDERFDMERINRLNDALALLAQEKGFHFLNLNEVLAGEDGWLKPEYGAPDGYHLTPIGYGAWVDYVRRHTASHRRHNHLYIDG